MPRASSEKKADAERMYKQGEKLADIAAKLRISENTVRSWKSRGKWDKTDKITAKKNNKTVAINATRNATLAKTLQKNVAKEKSVAKTLQKKKGAPTGNQNAKGNKGNSKPLPPPDKTDHGGYKNVYADLMTDEENDIYDQLVDDEEMNLINQVKLFTIRERRILKAINTVMQRDDYFYATDRVEHEGGKDGDFTETQRKNKYLVAARLEQELSTVQGKKTKSLSELSRIHLERQKMENTESNGNDDLVKAWADKIRELRKPKGGENDD